jgi:hypothetical protein
MKRERMEKKGAESKEEEQRLARYSDEWSGRPLILVTNAVSSRGSTRITWIN